MTVRRERAEVSLVALDEPSRRLLAAFDDHPAQKVASVFMEREIGGAWRLIIRLPSPTGDKRRTVSLWLDQSGVPSLEFGAWHTHTDLWDDDINLGLEKMLLYLERITDGSVQLSAQPATAAGVPYCIVDLENPDDVLDELTYPGAPNEVNLLSWSGAEDRTLDINSVGRPG